MMVRGVRGATTVEENTEAAILTATREMLQAMTGNYFVATTHRVITREARLSSAYFHADVSTSIRTRPPTSNC